MKPCSCSGRWIQTPCFHGSEFLEVFFSRKRTILFFNVFDRKTETILISICKSIEDGSIIYFDSWKAYETDELEEIGFEQYKVSFSFIDPDTGHATFRSDDERLVLFIAFSRPMEPERIKFEMISGWLNPDHLRCRGCKES